MNTNFNEYVRDIFNSKHALVRSFFHPLSDEEYEQAEIGAESGSNRECAIC